MVAISAATLTQKICSTILVFHLLVQNHHKQCQGISEWVEYDIVIGYQPQSTSYINTEDSKDKCYFCYFFSQGNFLSCTFLHPSYNRTKFPSHMPKIYIHSQDGPFTILLIAVINWSIKAHSLSRRYWSPLPNTISKNRMHFPDFLTAAPFIPRSPLSNDKWLFTLGSKFPIIFALISFVPSDFDLGFCFMQESGSITFQQ